MAESKKRGLGKGLEALLSSVPKVSATSTASDVAGGDQIIYLDPREIDPNPKQPRTHFAEDALQELAESLKRDGIQEPVIVRRKGDRYELVSGERRVRAAVMVDLEKVPAIVRDVSDADMLRLGLIENIQREDLNPIELAKGYKQLLDEFGWTQEELADQIGKKRVSVTNLLRLLNLPEDIQLLVAKGDISAGHARALLALSDEQAQRTICRKIMEKGLSVRDVEKLVGAPARSTKPRLSDPNLKAVEEELRRNLGTKVVVKSTGKNRGVVSIEYYSLDDLDRLLSILKR